MSVEIVGETESGAASTVLVEAFRDYPVIEYFLDHSSADYERRLRILMDFYCRTRYVRGYPVLGVRRRGGLVGTALVSEPGPGPAEEEIGRLFAELSAELGAAVIERMERYETVAKRGRPGEPYHYLGMLAVLPASQGEGIGGELVEAVQRLAEEHPSSSGVCLNTETSKNVPLYEHLGYRVVGEAELDALHTWCMFRPCRAR